MRFSLQTFFVSLLIFFVVLGGVFVAISVMVQQGLIVLGTLVVVGGALFFVIRALVVAPLQKLRASIQLVGEENFEVRLLKGPPNEIGDVFEAFNQMMERLQETKARGELVNRLKSEFISIAAHQLRTPLSATKWLLRLTLDRDLGTITKEQEDLFRKGYDMNERMIHLVSDLLDVTRIEEGRFGFQPKEVSLEELIYKIVYSFRQFAKERKVDLHLDLPPIPLPKVYADPERVGIALQNLVDNAIRYTPLGGRVRVEATEQDYQFLRVVVADTGVGISSDQLPRVFTKFFRGNNAVKLHTEGTGLGLYIAKNIIEAHHGSIWVESKEGAGTMFSFTLPIVQEKNRRVVDGGRDNSLV